MFHVIFSWGKVQEGNVQDLVFTWTTSLTFPICRVISTFPRGPHPAKADGWADRTFQVCVGVIRAKCLETIKQQFSERFACKRARNIKAFSVSHPKPLLFSQSQEGFGRLYPVRLIEGDVKCSFSSGGCNGWKGKTAGAGIRRAGLQSGQSGGFKSGTTEAGAAGVRKCQIFSLES